MEEQQLKASDLESGFKIEKTRENQWHVQGQNSENKINYDGSHYNCSCGQNDDSLPWTDCDHIYAVKQYELTQFDKVLLEQNLKSSMDILLWEIAEIEQEQASNNRAADHQIRRINHWREHSNSKLQRQIDSKVVLLRRYLEMSDRKTQKLSNGTIRLRKLQPRLILDDNIMEYLDVNFIRVIPAKYEPDMRVIRKHLTTTGEIIPGVSVESQQDKFSYEISNELKGENHHERNIKETGQASAA